MAFKSAVRLIEMEMWISPEGREVVVGGEHIAVGHCAARDDVLFGAGQLRVVRHFRKLFMKVEHRPL